ncbi:hypothetical protein MPSEU_000044000 [Mayamaea pseudoterrestris]|nr:hypothetical protein MPSEU_000044000 [Mayamaea pseudoterrestris]
MDNLAKSSSDDIVMPQVAISGQIRLEHAEAPGTRTSVGSTANTAIQSSGSETDRNAAAVTVGASSFEALEELPLASKEKASAVETSTSSSPPSGLIAIILEAMGLSGGALPTVSKVMDHLEDGILANLGLEDVKAVRAQSVEPVRLQLLQEFQQTNDLALLSQIRHAGAISKVIEIYEKAAKAVRMCQGTRQPASIAFEIVGVTDIVVNLMELHHPCELTVGLSSGMQMLLNSKQLPQSANVSLPSGHIQRTDGDDYKFKFSAAQEGTVAFDILARLSSGSVVVIGQAGTSIRNLDQVSTLEEESIHLDILPMQGSCLVAGAKLIGSVRRQVVPPTLDENQRVDARQCMEETLAALQLLNKDLANDMPSQSAAASTHIQVGGESLLHGAVRLGDLALVERLIAGGAPPDYGYRSDVNPLELSRNILRGCTEERMAELESIIEALEKGVPSQRDSGCANIPAAFSSEKNHGDTASLRIEAAVPSKSSLEPTQLMTSSHHFDTQRSSQPTSNCNSITRQAHVSNDAISLSSHSETHSSVDFNSQPAESAMSSFVEQTGLIAKSFPVLPAVQPSWILHPSRLNDRCHHQEASGSGCQFRHSASGCSFIHVHRPWGSRLEMLWEQIGGSNALTAVFRQQIAEQTFIYKVWDTEGTHWYTAKYSCLLAAKRTWQDVIFVEGGSCFQDRASLHWYKSESEARSALERAALVTFWAIQNNFYPSPGIPGPHQLLGESHKRLRTDAFLPSDTDGKRARLVNQVGADKQISGQLPTSRYIRMSGIPYEATKEDISDFFLKRKVDCESIVKVFKGDGNFIGVSYLFFANETDALTALTLHMEYMGRRYVKLKVCDRGEFERFDNLERNARNY